MNDSAAIDLTPLGAHLAADTYARLRAGALLPEQVQAECARLRVELAAITSYIPASIVRDQLRHPQPGRVSGAYWDGSVLFADLSGFTALSERLSALGKQGAEEISAIINALFSALLAEIHRYQGALLKFGGDALTAFFDAATLGADHAALAAGAALAMQRRMAEFAALATRGGTFQLRLRIGVHSGRVFAAQVGSVEHVELVVTGRNINRVAAAQEIAEPGEVVISEATRALLPAARTYVRAAGFHLLTALPPTPPIPPTPRGHFAMGAGDQRELLGLAARIDALRPYLPRNMPHRFLEASDSSAATGEYRPVTVLFANFAPFSAALDLLGEDSDTAAQVLNAYYARAQVVIHRYGGIVNKVDMYTHGDKLMALFGAPTAHEDDAVRAVRAALELRAALDEANVEIAELVQNQEPRAKNQGTAEPQKPLSAVYPFSLSQKIGLNTGVVFAGRVGSAQRHEYTVMGQHVNLAARLMAAAGAGAVVLSPATRRVVEPVVELRALPPVTLKGITAPVPIAEALRPREVAQGLRGLAQAALVGRDAELAQIVAEGGAALRGAGRVVALVGEAGTGKTRLIESALQRLILQTGQQSELPAFFPYHIECQSYEQNTPYAGLRDLLRQVFTIVAGMPAAPVLRRVAELAPDLARFTPLLRDLTGIALEDTPLTAALTPEQRHDRTEELVEALLLGEAREQPLVLIVDDLHWADASSLALLARLARRIASAPILMLLGYRTDPPIDELWCALPHTARLDIRELTQADGVALVAALLDGAPPEELATLIERTQGNPFFIEEVVRGLIESGALARGDAGWQLTRPLDETAVPDSIEGVITARLDRLDERSREVVQNAAVIGRRFPYPVLLGIIARGGDLRERLAWLAARDLIQTDDIERDTAYLFRQALTRDVAYETILYARRRELHLRVARQIEQIYAERLDDQLALLARHYLLAEEWPRAFDYHLRAGRQAQARYANREAIALLERTLAIADRLQGTGNREQGDDMQTAPVPYPLFPVPLIEVHERLGVIHALIGEYDAAMRHYEQAMVLLRGRDDAPLDDVVRLHHHIARVHEKRADFDTAFQWVERGLALAGAAQSAEVVRCLLLGAALHRYRGHYAQALEWGKTALQIAIKIDDKQHQAHALMLIGGTHSSLGDNYQAIEYIQNCLKIYEEIHDLAGISDTHNEIANVYYELGKLGEARKHYEASAALEQSIGDVYGQALVANNLGGVLRIEGYIDEAIKQYEYSLRMFQNLGSTYGAGVINMNLGAMYLLKHISDRAAEHLNQSVELFQAAGNEDFMPELYRSIAELHLQKKEIAQAWVRGEQSLNHAIRLEARVEEGATRRTLGQILAQSGDVQAAWQALEQSLALLRAAASPHEIARTLVGMAELAPLLNQHAAGQSALDEALPILRSVGAQRDIQECHRIAMLHGYTVTDAMM